VVARAFDQAVNAAYESSGGSLASAIIYFSETEQKTQDAEPGRTGRVATGLRSVASVINGRRRPRVGGIRV